MLVQRFLHNSTEGWALALTSLRDLYANAESVGAADPVERRAMVDEQDAAFLAEAMRLGKVIAEMHLALAAGAPGTDMEPAPMTDESLDTLGEHHDRRSSINCSRATTRHSIRLRDVRNGVVERFDQIRGLSPSGLLTRIHGDLHLGQLLRVDTGWVILDFEGEPDRTPAERRELQHAAARRRRDAALVRLRGRGRDHRARSAGQRRGSRRCTGSAKRGRTPTAMPSGARTSRRSVRRRCCPAPGPSLVLRRAFEVQKAVYEIGYELGHRPAWAAIPLRFLLRGVNQ